VSGPAISAIVRAKDKAGTIEATLRSLRRQTVPVEIVVVDSGSTDGTRTLAARYADRVLDLAPGEFTYGRALNVGAAAAGGAVHAALSAHCTLTRDDWLERALAHYERPDVAATNGDRHDADGVPLGAPLLQTIDHARRAWGWGYSNHASTWRADVWRQAPFDEHLVAEDKEWAFRVLGAGWLIAHDPALFVSGGHRQAQGLSQYYRRVQREAEAYAGFAPVPPLGMAGAARRWWRVAPGEPAIRRRASPMRSAGIAGTWTGRRRVLRRAGR